MIKETPILVTASFIISILCSTKPLSILVILGLYLLILIQTTYKKEILLITLSLCLGFSYTDYVNKHYEKEKAILLPKTTLADEK